MVSFPHNLVHTHTQSGTEHMQDVLPIGRIQKKKTRLHANKLGILSSKAINQQFNPKRKQTLHI